MNPTLLGLFSVLIWGAALPFVRLMEERISGIAYTGLTFWLIAAIGFLVQQVKGQRIERSAFRNPFFYGRWVCFTLHEGLILIAVAMVGKANLPLVILLNYLWPTAIIICSVLFAGVKILRWGWFIAGSATVSAALAIEIINPSNVSMHLFDHRNDCIAYGLAFVGAISWGFYSAFSRRSGDSSGAGRALPLFQMTLGFALPVSFLPHMDQWHGESLGVVLLIGCCCIIQYLAYVSWDIGMRLGNVVILSLLADLIPWLSLIVSHFMLDLEIGSKTVFSAALLVFGAMVTRVAILPLKKPIVAAAETVALACNDMAV